MLIAFRHSGNTKPEAEQPQSRRLPDRKHGKPHPHPRAGRSCQSRLAQTLPPCPPGEMRSHSQRFSPPRHYPRPTKPASDGKRSQWSGPRTSSFPQANNGRDETVQHTLSIPPHQDAIRQHMSRTQGYDSRSFALSKDIVKQQQSNHH